MKTEQLKRDLLSALNSNRVAIITGLSVLMIMIVATMAMGRARTGDIRALNSQLEDARSQLTSAQSQLDAANGTITGLTEKNRELTNSFTDLQSQNTELQNKNAALFSDTPEAHESTKEDAGSWLISVVKVIASILFPGNPLVGLVIDGIASLFGIG